MNNNDLQENSIDGPNILIYTIESGPITWTLMFIAVLILVGLFVFVIKKISSSRKKDS